MTSSQPGKRIDEVWLFIATDAEGEEGLMTMITPIGPAPLVAADLGRVEWLRPHAEAHAAETGRPVEIRHLTTIADTETIEP